MSIQFSEIEELHQQACEEGKSTYIDPETGMHVMTGYFLTERGYCCESKCRHCPYNEIVGVHKYKGKYIAVKDGEVLGWGVTSHYCHSVLSREVRQFDGTNFGYQMFYVDEDGKAFRVENGEMTEILDTPPDFC